MRPARSAGDRFCCESFTTSAENLCLAFLHEKLCRPDGCVSRFLIAVLLRFPSVPSLVFPPQSAIVLMSVIDYTESSNS